MQNDSQEAPGAILQENEEIDEDEHFNQ